MQFGVLTPVGKTWLCLGMVSRVKLARFHGGQMIPPGLATLWACQSAPKPSKTAVWDQFLRFGGFGPGPLGRAPLALWAYLPFVGQQGGCNLPEVGVPQPLPEVGVPQPRSAAVAPPGERALQDSEHAMIP